LGLLEGTPSWVLKFWHKHTRQNNKHEHAHTHDAHVSDKKEETTSLKSVG
jgi:hypothetical protein